MRSLDTLIAQDAIVTRNEALRVPPSLVPQYVIRSNVSQWVWCGGRAWSSSLTFAQRFHSIAEAMSAGSAGIPESPSMWRVELIAPVEGI
jgi:hypothetical protein